MPEQTSKGEDTQAQEMLVRVMTLADILTTRKEELQEQSQASQASEESDCTPLQKIEVSQADV